jgi:hypothetical protein
MNMTSSWYDPSLDAGWEMPLSTPGPGRPFATDGGGNTADVFFRDLSGRLEVSILKAAGWQSPGTIGTDTFTGPPVGVRGFYSIDASGALYVFANKSDGSIWYITIFGNQ